MRRVLMGLLATGVLSVACQRVEEPVKPLPITQADPKPASSAAAPASAALAVSAARPETPAAPVATPRCVEALPPNPPPSPPRGPAPGCPADPEKKGKLGRVAPVAVEGTSVKVTAEIARTEEDVTRGLMYRTQMGEDEGMLFRLDSRRQHAFWMHNTCIPLDMLFVDDDGTIVGVVENVPTLNDVERKVRCSSLYVPETNAGWVRRQDVRPGQTLVIPEAAR